MTDEELQAALRAHVGRAFPGRTVEAERGTAQVREVIPAFEVLRVAPAAKGEPWVHASIGAWEATRDESVGVEFVLVSRHRAQEHVATVSICAYFHSFYGLGLGRTMKVARGWVEGSSCDRLLLAAPAFAPGLETCEAGGRRVRFLRLVPITQDEAAFLEAHGAAELVARLERADLLDPGRAAVV